LDQADTLDKQHGRVERRSLQASTRLAAHLDWPGLAQVCRIDRHTHRGGKLAQETAYAITSVPSDVADAAQLLEWKRGHWGIENRLHYVRDVTFGEDASQIRKGGAPQCLAAFRNAAITFLRSTGVTNIAAVLRKNAYHLSNLFPKLGILKQ
jgi:predicted transposase YbfD/YdcC